MTEHTHKQFDTEMEAIRSGVLTMGGLVETQMSRAIVLEAIWKVPLLRLAAMRGTL